MISDFPLKSYYIKCDLYRYILFQIFWILKWIVLELINLFDFE